jgi:hypothetical protein
MSAKPLSKKVESACHAACDSCSSYAYGYDCGFRIHRPQPQTRARFARIFSHFDDSAYDRGIFLYLYMYFAAL